MATTVSDYALGIWQHGDNDAVWEACFRWAPDVPDLVHEDPSAYPDGPTLTDVAGELLERIERDPSWTVGDLSHEEVVSAILRRHPLLGPPPA